jgi:fluoride ion exporter CrcB/FEX
MEFDQVGILLISVAAIAALVLGALVGHFVTALVGGLVVWVLLLFAWNQWGPPLPYHDLTTNIAGSVGLGIVLCFLSVFASWVRRRAVGS